MSIQSLPYPALEIVSILSKAGNLTAKEIQERLGDDVESKAVKYALRRLLENHVIFRVPNLLDMRSVFYRAASADELSQLANELSPEMTGMILEAMNSEEKAKT